MSRTRRLLAAASCLALLCTAAPARAEHYYRHVTPGVHACQTVPPTGFTDIAGNAHERAIACLPRYGVAQGLTPTRYGPGEPVRRDQLASFLLRALTELRVALPAGEDRFRDLDGNVHRDAVERLAAAGVVNGTGPSTFAPGALVTREQMATFLWRAFVVLEPDRADATAYDYFNDDEQSSHERNIDRAFEHSLVGGQTEPGGYDEYGAPFPQHRGTYAPAEVVRRDQMASFLARFLDAGLRHGPGANPEPYDLGEQGPLRDGWTMSVEGADDDATPEVLAHDPSNEQPRPEHRYVIFRVRATYDGPGTSTLDGYDRLRVRPVSELGDPSPDSQPAAHRPCGTIPFDLPNPETATGGTVEGNVCFELRKDQYYFLPHLFDSRWRNAAYAHFQAYTGEPRPHDEAPPSPYLPPAPGRSGAPR